VRSKAGARAMEREMVGPGICSETVGHGGGEPPLARFSLGTVAWEARDPELAEATESAAS
jgi:hypothetical protein